MIKFSYTILYVRDVEKTLTFYEQAFGFLRKFITPEKDYGELDTGNTTLSFALHRLAQSNLSCGFFPRQPQERPLGIEICFITDDMKNALKKAADAGALIITPPKHKPWGQTVAFLRDPEGFLIELATEITG
ncbi:hypothetical protein CHS0354_035208 [Potamilus streckersoni]|uniref:Glyoxalase domain-containing protein 5 n=1 Tax=Potamilus streckersoni TaxID=2493646 RepID=A0AAE0VMW6_9BIVA|nr:hypothetical protein CHS0354_035208 [Potamilus streckersoni]